MAQTELKEADLARKLIQSLLSEGWTVYEEVVLHGSRVDIVATQGPLVVAYECKLHLNLEVLAQAEHWKRYAHQTWVVTPWPRSSSRAAMMGIKVCQSFGIGCMAFSKSGQSFEVKVDPVLQRKAMVKTMRAALVEEQITTGSVTSLAGTNRGGYSTPYRRTVTAIQGYLRSNGGRALLKEVMANIKHHYHSSASAKSTIRLRVLHNLVPGVVLEYEGRQAFLKLT